MSSILLHGLTDISSEELIILFESKFKEVEIVDIEISLKFESAIIYFKDEKSANEILEKFTEIKLAKDFGVYSLKISKEKYDQSNANKSSNQFVNDKIIKSQQPNQPIQFSSSISQNFNVATIESYNKLPSTSHNSSNNRYSFSNIFNNDNDRYTQYGGLTQSGATYNITNQRNHNSDNCQPLNQKSNPESISSNINSLPNKVTNENYSSPTNSANADLSFSKCNNNDYEMTNENNSKPQPMETDEGWEQLNNTNIRNYQPDVVNNMDRENTVSEGKRFSRTIVLTENNISIKAKIYLINQMIACGGQQIKNGCQLKLNDGLVELLSNSETDLETYFNELSEMFESYYSETELDVSKRLENVLRTQYGCHWAICILRSKKIVAYFKKDKVSVVGFSADESKEGVNCIKKNFVKACIKKVDINIKKFPNVDISIDRNIGSCCITGLPPDVIRAAHTIECGEKSYAVVTSFKN